MRGRIVVLAGLLMGVAACDQPLEPRQDGVEGAGPALVAASGRQTVVVNPDASGNGVAATINEALGMVASGGTVLVTPGTYPEPLVIGHGVTIEPIASGEGEVVLAPPTGTVFAIQVIATDPVTIRGIRVEYPGAVGVRAEGPVDLLLDGMTVRSAVPATTGHGILVLNDPAFTPFAGGRGRARVIGTTVDAGVLSELPPHAQNHGLRAMGDVDVVFAGNTVRHTGGACIFITPRADLTGVTNAEIIDNDLDDCYPLGRVSSILVGVGSAPASGASFTATGTVNIIGNRIRNSSATCRLASAISYENFSGAIEHNSILGVVQGCATATVRNLTGAISLGSLFGVPGNTATVRFNDLAGNAFAGLRLEPNVTLQVDARCNWWGAADGPSGLGTGSGDALLVEPGAPAPTYLPYATAPIAGTGATGC